MLYDCEAFFLYLFWSIEGVQLLLELGRTCFESIQPFSLGYSKLDRECTGCGGILLVKRDIPLAIGASSSFFEPGIPNEKIDLIYLRVS